MKLFFTYSRNSDFASRLIQAITKSKWTHCGIILDQELFGDPLVIDCAWDRGGVRLTFWSLIQRMPHEVFEVIKYYPLEAQIGAARAALSIRYSYIKILLYPIKKYLGEAASNKCISFLNKLGLSDPWKTGAWCSEFAAMYLLNIGALLSIAHDLETITPEDLYQIALKSPQFKKVE